MRPFTYRSSSPAWGIFQSWRAELNFASSSAQSSPRHFLIFANVLGHCFWLTSCLAEDPSALVRSRTPGPRLAVSQGLSFFCTKLMRSWACRKVDCLPREMDSKWWWSRSKEWTPERSCRCLSMQQELQIWRWKFACNKNVGQAVARSRALHHDPVR